MKEEVGHADLEATWPKVVRSKSGAVGMSKPLDRGERCIEQEPEEGMEPDDEPEEEEGLVQDEGEGGLAESQGPEVGLVESVHGQEKEVELAELVQGLDEREGFVPGPGGQGGIFGIGGLHARPAGGKIGGIDAGAWWGGIARIGGFRI